MPDPTVKNYEAPVPERDVERISQEVKKIRETPEGKSLSGQEVLKQSVRAAAGVPRPSQTTQAAPPAATSPLPAYAQDAPAGAKLEIEHLIELARRQGLESASREAAKTNPFVMDAFHDAVTAHLYPEFKKRGFVD